METTTSFKTNNGKDNHPNVMLFMTSAPKKRPVVRGNPSIDKEALIASKDYLDNVKNILRNNQRPSISSVGLTATRVLQIIRNSKNLDGETLAHVRRDVLRAGALLAENTLTGKPIPHPHNAYTIEATTLRVLAETEVWVRARIIQHTAKDKKNRVRRSK